MGRLIDEDAVIKAILQLDDLIYTIPDYIDAVRSVPSAEPESRREWYMKGYRDAQRCADIVDDMPTIEPQRMKGKWLKAYGDHEAFGIRPFYRYCSECNESTVFPYNFCPHCGADMRGTE